MRPQRRVLLVEGRDDREVILQLGNARGFNTKDAPLFDVKASGGDTNQRVDLALMLTAAILGEHAAVGVVADADVDAAARWASLCDVLRPHGYAPPAEWPADGWVGQVSGMPTVGIWIMGAPSGALEEHLLGTLGPDDALVRYARQSVESAPPDPRRFRDSHRTKAVAHAFLALIEPPGTPLGLAIPRQLFAPDHPANVALAEWLLRTFG